MGLGTGTLGGVALGSGIVGSAAGPASSSGFTTNYQTEAAKKSISTNYVVQFSGFPDYFSKKAVVGITAKKYIEALQFNPSKISLESVKTSVGSLSFDLIDPGAEFLTGLMAFPIHESTVTLWIGFEPLNFADYKKVAEYRVRTVDYDGRNYKVKATDRLDDLQETVTVPTSALSADVTSGATSIPLLDASGFSTSGTGKLERESFTWTGKSGNTLTGATRGVNGSDAAAHDAGEEVTETKTVQDHPLNILLKLLTSPGGGGAYDTLTFGIAFPSSRVNVTKFENLRDNSSLTGQTWKVEISESIENFLDYAEKEILFFTNTRLFIDIDGKLSIALVQEITLDNFGGSLLEADVDRGVFPTSVADSGRVYNRVRARWDWNEGTEKYQKEQTYNDTTSQGKYGVIEGKTITSKAIRQGLDGQAIIDDFAGKLLRRQGFPVNVISRVRAFTSKQFFDIGQKIQLNHPDAVNLITGEKGINQIVEILERKPDLDSGLFTYTINAAEELNENWAFISPASNVASGTSQTVFTLVSGEVARAGWSVGWEISLWEHFGTAPVGTATISAISGDQITVDTALGVTPSTAHRIEFAQYDLLSSDQKVLYASLSDGALAFSDGRTPYLVTD